MPGLSAAAVSTSCSAWRRSRSVATPPVCRDLVSASDSSRVCRVRLEISRRIVEFTQREVGCSDVADQRRDDGFAVFLRAQKIGARGLGGAPQPAPDVDFERQQLQRGRSEIAILRRQKLPAAAASRRRAKDD